ncbi:glycosyltransferase family 10 domain-containing protein [Aliarcobacter butzleri]
MKKACIVLPKYLQNNAIFDKNSKLNRDNIFNKYIELKKELQKYGFDLSTNDINIIEESEIIFYFDMPKTLPNIDKIKNSFLILVESELIRPDNYHLEKHKYFNKIFTWHDELVDDKKYFKLNFSHLFPKSINKDLSKKQKLCTLIAGNKRLTHPLELYSKRIEAIRWFEKNHPQDFDLYGVGWDKYRFSGPILIRAFNRVPFLPKLFAKLTGQNYPSYKGMVENKKETMEKYKFSICYENAKDIPGYITEKIFDSFFAGCIPIYWGANNILEYIPKECFIDFRDFDSYNELYKFIRNMNDNDYMNYLENIEYYLKSELAFQFTGIYFSKKISTTIIKGTVND